MNISTQHWFCRSLQWFCDGGGMQRVNAPVAPEIHGTALVLGIALALGGLAILNNWRPRS